MLQGEGGCWKELVHIVAGWTKELETVAWKRNNDVVKEIRYCCSYKEQCCGGWTYLLGGRGRMLRPEEDFAFYGVRGKQGAGLRYCVRTQEEEKGCDERIQQHMDDDKRRLL